MGWLIEMNKGRAVLLLAIAALLLTTACWASVFKGPNGDPGSYKDGVDRSYPGSAKGEPGSSRDREATVVTPYDGSQGIHVNATGSVAVEPDIAIISLGVESLEDTASEARATAAEAMAGVVAVLAEAGIEDRDIQTRHFNISPRHREVRVTNCIDDEDKELESFREDSECTTSWEVRLIGYVVSNQASVKIRNLDDAGTIIDQVTDAAGDLVRVNGITFTVDEPAVLREEARTKAIEALREKAEIMADLAGVKLGRLVHLQESPDFYSPQPAYARAVSESAEFAGDTSISAGEIEFTARVSGVYLIAE